MTSAWICCLAGHGAEVPTPAVDATPAAAIRPISPEELAPFVDGVVSEAMQTQHIAGAVVSVVQAGHPVFIQGYGIAGIDPTRPVDPLSTSFRIGSVTKAFTWTLLMQLIEQGKVSLDAPVNRYLPRDLQIPDDSFKPIRVMDLMAHATGFEDAWLGFVVTENPSAIVTPRNFLIKHRPRRVREPGLFSTYSNYGAALAGAIIENVSGVDIQSAAERSIFEPLGMTHSTFREPYPSRPDLPAPMSEELAPLQTTGFTWGGGRFVAHKPEYFTMLAASATISSTAPDMARFMLMQLRDGNLDGNRVYGARAAKAFRTAILPAPEGVNGWAHGLMVLDLPGGYKGYGHAGGTLYQNAFMVIVPALDLGVFVATNTASGGGLISSLHRQIVEHFYAKPVLQRSPDPTLADHAWKYEGVYYSTRRAYHGLEKFVGLLLYKATVSVAGGYLLTGGGGDTRAWVPEGAPGRFRDALGEDVLVFQLDSHGRATSFGSKIGTSRYERAGFLLAPAVLEGLVALSIIVAVGIAVNGVLRIRRNQGAALRSRLTDVLAVLVGILWILDFAVMMTWVLTLDENGLAFVFPDSLLRTGSILAIGATASTVALALASLTLFRRNGWPRTNVLLRSSAILILLACSAELGLYGLLSV